MLPGEAITACTGSSEMVSNVSSARFDITQRTGRDQIHASRPFAQQLRILFKFDIIAHKYYSSITMKKIESLFITICLFAIITITGVAIWSALKPAEQGEPYKFPATKYGSFLAAQHAIYVNDFARAFWKADFILPAKVVISML